MITVLVATSDGGGHPSALVTFVGVLVLLLVLPVFVVMGRRKHNEQQKLVAQRRNEQSLMEDARARHFRDLEAKRAWELHNAEASIPRYCQGCGLIKGGVQMVWTVDGQYRCRECAPEVSA